jgi:hypothetical protein
LGGACDTRGRDEKFLNNYGRNMKLRDDLEDAGVYERIILKHILNE